MYRDPRGPNHIATKVEETPTETLVTLDCGHVAHLASHFHYKVGSWQRCFKCGQEAVSP